MAHYSVNDLTGLDSQKLHFYTWSLNKILFETSFRNVNQVFEVPWFERMAGHSNSSVTRLLL
jgi:hypothetical protein